MRCVAQFGIVCTILKNVKNTHGEVLLLGKLECTFTKSITPPWVFFTFFELYKWYQIAQKRHIFTCQIGKNENVSKINYFQSDNKQRGIKQ